MASWNGAVTPPPAPPPPAYGRREGGRRGSGRRWTAAALLFLSFALAITAAVSPWWYDTVSVTNSSGTAVATDSLLFSPGSTSYISCSGTYGYSYGGPCDNSATNWGYATGGLPSLGGVYVLMHVTSILAAVLGLLTAVFMIMGAAGRGWGRWHFHTTHLLALFIGIMALLAPAVLLTLQPGLVTGVSATDPSQGPSYYFLGPQAQDCGANTPNGTFWASCTYSQGSYYAYTYQATWGAGLGWYASLVSALFALLGGALYLSSRQEGTSSGAPRSYAPSAWGAPSSPGRAALGPGGASSAMVPLTSDGREMVPALAYAGASVVSNRTSCRACGHLNPVGSALCTRCHAPLM
ncbi:MAG: hypothetical protein KGJ23_02345 [Euryarchaeota archaeon]|nr:hypothetical protein [Euryarchaeota archaeon]MDE1835436.1 hypothetical protein [Euryarchaeota archaeon]MDE1879572.1 hypothetical protein [Euryarchaeota archaeon]MDE2046087.1 hypothetical protein [Thermoplasmata archaeon]